MISNKKIIRRKAAGYYYDNKGRVQQVIKFFKAIHCPVWNIKYDWYNGRKLIMGGYIDIGK